MRSQITRLAVLAMRTDINDLFLDLAMAETSEEGEKCCREWLRIEQEAQGVSNELCTTDEWEFLGWVLTECGKAVAEAIKTVKIRENARSQSKKMGQSIVRGFVGKSVGW